MKNSLPNGKNPFLPNEVVPISILSESPYQQGVLLRQVVAPVLTGQNIRRAEVEPCIGYNPYKTVEEFATTTGSWLTPTHQCYEPMRGRGLKATLGKHRKSLEKFSVEYDGIYLRPKNTLKEEPIQLANFDFWIVERIERHCRDGSVVDEVVFVVLEHEKEPQRIACCDYNAKLIDQIISKFPDCCITSPNTGWAKNLLREYASARYSDALRNIEKKVIYGYHGWEVLEGKHVFLSAARSDCECDCYVPEIDRGQEAAIWQTGLSILDIGRQVVNEDGSVDYCRTYRASLPFWLYLHTGYASKLFQDAGVSLQFILVIVGKSGSLKTSTCKAFAEPFHPGGMLRLESTPRALELYRESCLDQNMIADDIFCEKGAMMAKFEDIIRAFGDEVGRAKACGSNFEEIVRTKVRGSCIVTAENQPDSQQSSALRYVTLRFEPNSIDPEILGRFQENQRHSLRLEQPSWVQNYFAGWVHFLERRYDNIVDFIEAYQPPALALRFKRHQKIYRAFLAVARLVLEWGNETGAISKEEEDRLFALWLEIITALIKQNEDMAITAEPWQQFILVLQAGIGTGGFLLAYTKEEYEGNSGKFSGYKRLGKMGDIEYVLAPESTYAYVKGQMLSSEKKLVAKPMEIYRDLCAHEIAQGYNEQANGKSTRNRYLKRVKLHGHQVEMLVMSADAMERCIAELRGDA